LAAAVGVSVAGCGGSPTAPQRDEVYYLHEAGVIDRRYSWERYFPPLDREAQGRVPRRVGVAIFEGDVRFSRPVDWYLRSANYTPEARQVSYQSPRQFVVNIYERTDPPEETWEQVLTRYEEDVEAKGSEILSKRVPTTTANAQGRTYLIKSTLESNPEPYSTHAHEIMVRSDKRVMLIQIIHGESVDASIDEMMAMMRTMLIY
jgi:hypothetical protein